MKQIAQLFLDNESPTLRNSSYLGGEFADYWSPDKLGMIVSNFLKDKNDIGAMR